MILDRVPAGNRACAGVWAGMKNRQVRTPSHARGAGKATIGSWGTRLPQDRRAVRRGDRHGPTARARIMGGYYADCPIQHRRHPFTIRRAAAQRPSGGPSAPRHPTRGLSQNEGLEALRVAKAAVDLSPFLRGERTRCPARFFVSRVRAMPFTFRTARISGRLANAATATVYPGPFEGRVLENPVLRHLPGSR